jgi:hypothetical protein
VKNSIGGDGNTPTEAIILFKKITKKNKTSFEEKEFKKIKVKKIKTNKDNTHNIQFKEIELESGKEYLIILFLNNEVKYGDNQMTYKNNYLVVTEGCGFTEMGKSNSSNNSPRHFLGKIYFVKSNSDE